MAKQSGRALVATIGVGLLLAAGCTSDDDGRDEPPPDEPAVESIDERATAADG